MNQSCFNCRYLTNSITSNHEWSCGHPNSDSLPYQEPGDDMFAANEDVFAEYYAKSCPAYEFRDWEKLERFRARQQAMAEDDLEFHLRQAQGMNSFNVGLYFGAWNSRNFIKITPLSQGELYAHYRDLYPTAQINIVTYEPD